MVVLTTVGGIAVFAVEITLAADAQLHGTQRLALLCDRAFPARRDAENTAADCLLEKTQRLLLLFWCLDVRQGVQYVVNGVLAVAKRQKERAVGVRHHPCRHVGIEKKDSSVPFDGRDVAGQFEAGLSQV